MGRFPSIIFLVIMLVRKRQCIACTRATIEKSRSAPIFTAKWPPQKGAGPLAANPSDMPPAIELAPIVPKGRAASGFVVFSKMSLASSHKLANRMPKMVGTNIKIAKVSDTSPGCKNGTDTAIIIGATGSAKMPARITLGVEATATRSGS